MWTDNLPPNLELLAILNPSSPSIDNVSIAPPMVFDVVIPGELSELGAGQSGKVYRCGMIAARRARCEGAPRSSTRGGRKVSRVSRDDVLACFQSLSPVGNFFVLGFAGLLKGGSAEEFKRLVYADGIAADCSFVSIPMDEFGPVFEAAWGDLISPNEDSAATVRGLARRLGCSPAKAKRLIEPYKDSADILMRAAGEVSRCLWFGLRQAA